MERIHDPVIFQNVLDGIDLKNNIVATYYMSDRLPGVDFIDHYQLIESIAIEGSTGSWQRVEDHIEKLRLPRVVLLNGETGTAKTTLMRNISKVWGVPMYILNAHEDMKVSDMTMGLNFQAGKFQLLVKEFADGPLPSFNFGISDSIIPLFGPISLGSSSFGE